MTHVQVRATVATRSRVWHPGTGAGSPRPSWRASDRTTPTVYFLRFAATTCPDRAREAALAKHKESSDKLREHRSSCR